jgi:hypothetical protein
MAPSMAFTVIGEQTASKAFTVVPGQTTSRSFPTAPVPSYYPGSAMTHGERNNAGAIAGGVVGGLAVVALAVIAVVFIKRRYPRKQVAAVQAVPQPIARPVTQPPTYFPNRSSEISHTAQQAEMAMERGDAEFEEWNEKGMKKAVN